MKLHTKLLITTSMLLVLAGLAGLLPMAYFWNKNRSAMANAVSSQALVKPAPAPAPRPDLISGNPTHITIASVGIDLHVIDGFYNSTHKTWTLTHDNAQFMTPSAPANNSSGNTLIYGHAEKQIFGNLKKLTVGDEAVLITSNGYKFTYAYRANQAVDPTNVDILAYQGLPQLTLQTCSGTWWQNRQFYYFDLTSVTKQ